MKSKFQQFNRKAHGPYIWQITPNGDISGLDKMEDTHVSA